MFSTASIMAMSQPASSQVLTEFELNADNAEIKEFSTNFSSLGNTNFNRFFKDDENFESGDNNFDFVTQFFVPNSSGQYFFGQSEAPVDTVMIVYKGEFDPQNPSDNFFRTMMILVASLMAPIGREGCPTA